MSAEARRAASALAESRRAAVGRSAAHLNRTGALACRLDPRAYWLLPAVSVSFCIT